MQVEVQDGSFNYKKLEQVTNQLIESSLSEPALQKLMTSFRASVPQVLAPVNRTKAEALG